MQSSKEQQGEINKKDFLSDQCKEIEENKRIGNTGDLFKKIRNAKEIIHEKIGSIKDRDGMCLTEAEYIINVKNTQKNYAKKFFMTQIIMIV